MRMAYPFSAIVGQDEMKLALLVAATDPGIGALLPLMAAIKG
jgi:magnesium chelatase subunit I